MKLSWTVAVSVALLGTTMLWASETGWLEYGIRRVENGSTATISGRCHRLPSNWTIVQGGTAASAVDVRRHFGPQGYEFAVVTNADELSIPISEQPTVGTPTKTGFVIHSIRPVTGNTAMQFAALRGGDRLAIVGMSEESVRDLAARLETC
jgi:hypothetical protein